MKPEMLWIDMETTGLSAEFDVPLELGLALTDKYGNILDTWKTLVYEDTGVYQVGILRGLDEPIIKEMHTENGLWLDLNTKPKLRLLKAESAAIEWLTSHGVKAFTLPMAGSSIGSLDRPFCIKYFPRLHRFFHYRNIDVSTVKELCRMHNPGLFGEIQNNRPDSELSHRVLSDIKDSIHEYQQYLEYFLATESSESTAG